MASIVYITDRQMIDYHRLNGNRTINFWRPSSLRKIGDFEKGDLLFFMVKGTEKANSKEKGIIGYGKFVSSSICSTKQMWNKYKNLNGFDDEKNYNEAIIRLSKTKQLPAKINGLLLENCTYFQSPIYLSEIGIKVSNMVESYFYLDKHDHLATEKILKTAHIVGEDSWFSMINEEDEMTNYQEDLTEYAISNIINQYNIFSNDNKKSIKLAEKFIKQSQKENDKIKYIKGSKIYSISSYKNKIEIFIPFVSSKKNDLKQIQLYLGHIISLKETIKEKNLNINIEISIVFSSYPQDEYLRILERNEISYFKI